MKKVVLGSIALLLFTAGVGAQEAVDRPASEEGQGRASSGVEGVFFNAIQRYDQIVVSDKIYALPKTLMIDGDKRLAGQVMDRLDEDEQVKLQLSDERRDGYPVVRGIETNP